MTQKIINYKNWQTRLQIHRDSHIGRVRNMQYTEKIIWHLKQKKIANNTIRPWNSSKTSNGKYKAMDGNKSGRMQL